LDLRRQIAIIRAWLPAIIASVVLAAVAALVFSNLQAKVYEAKATLIVGQSLSTANPDYNQLLVSQRLSTTYAQVVTTRPILESVSRQLGLDTTADDLARRIHADAPADSTLMTITVQDGDPARAAAIANALADQLIAASPTIQGHQAAFLKSIDADLNAVQDQIVATQTQADALTGLTLRTSAQDAQLQALEGRLASLRATYATLLTFSSSNAANLLSVVEPAEASTLPVAPKPLLNVLVAIVVGLLIVLAIAFTVEYLDDRVKDPDVVQQVAHLNTLGTIGIMKGDRSRSEIYRLVALVQPRSGAAEAYRSLRANIEFAAVDAPIRTLLVTSARQGEGKTVTAANLAVAFAQAGRSVILIDADLRKPGAHVIFNLPNAQGLTSMLRTDEASVDAVAQTVEQANLRVVPSGPLPPNPAELLGSRRMRSTIDRLAVGEDLLIFDGPPLQAVTDSAILSSFLDATLLVIDASKSSRTAVRVAADSLAKAGANVLGVALNRASVQDRPDYAGYGEYPGEGDLPPRPVDADAAVGKAGL
jgi:polysaccharide biosynthesis transport protein